MPGGRYIGRRFSNSSQARLSVTSRRFWFKQLLATADSPSGTSAPVGLLPTLTRAAIQPLSRCPLISRGGSALLSSTTLSRSHICVPLLLAHRQLRCPGRRCASGRARCAPRHPLSCCKRRYSSRSRSARSLLAAFGPLRGLVLPVAMCMAYLLSTLNTVTPISPLSPCTARRSPIISAALLLCQSH